MSFISDIFAGKTTVTPKLSRQQKAITGQQVELGEFQLEQLKKQVDIQAGLFADVGEAATSFDELISGFTGAATPEQTELINQAISRALEAGETDIRRFQSQQTEQLRQELAPQLGLRTGDTPILDRGARIGAESVRQQGQLVSQLEGQRASTLLNFPQQIQQFQSQLAQNAFLNRLNLGGAQSTAGLGLAGVATPQAGALLAQQGSVSTNPAGGFASFLGGLGGLGLGLGALGVGGASAVLPTAPSSFGGGFLR